MVKLSKHPNTKVCSDECRTKYRAFKDKIRRRMK